MRDRSLGIWLAALFAIPGLAVLMLAWLWPVLESGDLEGFASRKGLRHAPMHLYKADELRELFKDCEILEMAGSNVTIHEHSQVSEQIAASPAAWATLVELERRLCHEPGLLDSGSHIIMVARR